MLGSNESTSGQHVQELKRSPTSRPASRTAAPSFAQVITPSQNWQMINFGELWQYRELLYFLAWRDVKVRYKQTILGAAWALLQPTLMMIVFTIFFSRMANLSSGGIPYPLFSYAGLVPWTFFATAISSAGNSVVGSERMITKIYFPRLAVPFAAVGAAVVDFFIAQALLLAMLVCYGVTPGRGLPLVLPLLFILGLAALGVGTLLAALNVYYRDFKYVIPFLIQIWMFATPAIYMQPRDEVVGSDRTILALNPLNALIAAFRNASLSQQVDWKAVAVAALLVAALFILGCLYFRRVEDEFADFI
jgi:lipopolysaccharide transport system permease protein